MKAVILAGGLGSRLSEETTVKPKPMVEIGGKPILWHIMKIYAAYGVEDFVVCLGYRGYVIKEWFANYALHTSDVTFDLRDGTMEVHHSSTEPWRVTLVDTGDETMTGGRLRRVARFLGDETFCLTYGDGVADVDVTALIARHREIGGAGDRHRGPGARALRRARRRAAARTASHGFREKPPGDGAWINGGFFVCEPAVIETIERRRDPLGGRAAGRARRARRAGRPLPRRLLARDGHAARPPRARGAVERAARAVAGVVVSATVCRFCAAPLHHVFADLGMSPLANSYLAPEQANAMEPFYPLRALVCEQCLLVQLEEFEAPSHIFSDYAYFSSYSTSWLEHCAALRRARRRALRPRRDAATSSSWPPTTATCCSTSTPAASRCSASSRPRTSRRSRCRRASRRSSSSSACRRPSRCAIDSRADLLLGNNVLAHVPDLNDFVGGMKVLLAEGGVITMEFPHLARLIDLNQWDTIYHEHFSYFSLSTVRRVFAAHGLRIFDVEQLPTHGGSLRIYGCHDDDADKPDGERVQTLAGEEQAAGLDELATYLAYGERVVADKRHIVSVLLGLKERGPADRRLRRAGEGQHAAELLRAAHRRARLHVRPQPAQAGPLPARDAHPDPLARLPARRPARRRADPALEHQGRDHGAAVVHPGVGRAVRRAVARAEALR